ncbi:hypothetical protein C0J52_07928 [Blattella germanica]|nr:hypothetical protein C0J52_07928 [Blattella germanica]
MSSVRNTPVKRKAQDDTEIEEIRKCPFGYYRETLNEGAQSANTNASTSNNSETSSPHKGSCPDASTKQVTESEPVVESVEQAENENFAMDVESNALREFDVLDEEEYDQDSENQSERSFDSDVPDEEIERMLEEGLPEEFKGRRKISLGQKEGEGASSPYEEKEKIVLEEIGHNHFDVLPEGWLQVTHNSGMPIYLHKQSRVCTLSQPYFLGPGSARKHEVPLSAIPCLQYRRALEAEQNKQQAPASNSEPNSSTVTNGLGEGTTLPSACIETIQENKATQSLNAIQVREYCQKSWSDRRRFTKQRKYQRLQRPTLPEGTKLIKFPLPVQNQDSGKGQPNVRGPKKEWIMNPNGKSYVCILHEYVQHALKKQPSYEFKELENAATPYAATVSITGMRYGVGYGTSKKQAKSEAAKATLEILIPQMREKIQEDKRVGARGTSKGQNSDLSFFDEIKIEDPRVAELCAKTTEPSPYAILLTCLQRNFGLGEMHIKYEVNTLRHQKNEFTMTVGRHIAKVICKNKRDGKQRASQSILQSIKEKKQEEQEITLLQSKASVNSPNFAILNKLKTEMKKLIEIKVLKNFSLSYLRGMGILFGSTVNTLLTGLGSTGLHVNRPPVQLAFWSPHS